MLDNVDCEKYEFLNFVLFQGRLGLMTLHLLLIFFWLLLIIIVSFFNSVIVTVPLPSFGISLLLVIVVVVVVLFLDMVREAGVEVVEEPRRGGTKIP